MMQNTKPGKPLPITAIGTRRIRQLEKYLAALRIREIRDRSISSTSRETASVDYEGMEIGALRKQVDRRDPSNSLAYQSDVDRYTGVA